jgi:hypothetical protein
MELKTGSLNEYKLWMFKKLVTVNIIKINVYIVPWITYPILNKRTFNCIT